MKSSERRNKEMVRYEVFRTEDCQNALDFWSGMPGVHLHTNGEDSVEGIEAYIRRNEGSSFIAWDEDKMVGAIMCGHDGRRGMIYHLAIAPEYRRMGVGKKLMQLSVGKLKEAGIKKCMLLVLKDNELGKSFYPSIGWNEEKMVDLYSKLF